MKTKLNSKLWLFAAALAFAITIFAKPIDANAAVVAPTNLKQTDATDVSVTVTWDKSATPVVGYNVQISTDKQNWKDVGYSLGNGKVYPGDAKAEIYTLSAGTTYYVRVCAKETQTVLGEYSAILAVDTAPAALSGLKQTDVSAQTATLTWSSSAGATGYSVLYGTSDNIAAAIPYQDVATTSINMNLGVNSAYYVFVFPFRSEANTDFKAINSGYKLIAVTTPSAPSDLTLYSRKYSSKSTGFAWLPTSTQYNTDGYEFEVYTLKTNGKAKRLKKVVTNSYETNYVNIGSSSLFTAPFEYRVRAYVTIDGQKKYSSWTGYKQYVPGAVCLSIKHARYGAKSGTLKWKKVSGATSYTVYWKSTANGKWKAVKKNVKGTSATVKYSSSSSNYYYVQANKVKIGKKKPNSSSLSKQLDGYVVR